MYFMPHFLISYITANLNYIVIIIVVVIFVFATFRGCRGVIKALSNHWLKIQQVHHSRSMIVSKFENIIAFCSPAFSHFLPDFSSSYYGGHLHLYAVARNPSWGRTTPSRRSRKHPETNRSSRELL